MANPYRSGIDFYDGVIYECNSKYSKFGVARAVGIAATVFITPLFAIALIASHDDAIYYPVPLIFLVTGILVIAGCSMARFLIGKKIKERLKYLEEERGEQSDWE